MNSNAWLLNDTNNNYFAVSDVEMIEYLPKVNIFSVPLSPNCCHHVIYWRERLTPVINLARLIDETQQTIIEQVAIIAYQKKAQRPLDYIAIAITLAPTHIVVNDTQSCQHPEQYQPHLQQLALSCFEYKNKSVAILDINYLCSNQALKNHSESLTA